MFRLQPVSAPWILAEAQSADRSLQVALGRCNPAQDCVTSSNVSLLSCITDKGDHLLLAVKAQPRASRNAIEGELGSELRVKITAPPVDSAANEALVRYIAEIAGVKRGQVELVRGGASRHKILAIHGLTVAELSAKLSAA